MFVLNSPELSQGHTQGPTHTVTDATLKYIPYAVRRVHIVALRVARLRLWRHSCVTLSPWQRAPPRLPFPASPPSPNQLAVLKRRGRSKRRPVQRRQHGACVWLQSCAHREESSLVLRAGPAQLDIEAAARASRAVGLELGDGAEPGARPGGKADGCGHGKVHVVRASVSLARPDGSPVGPSPHRAAGPLRETRQVIVGAAAHLAAGRGARSASTHEV